jgi:hypothetical protein
MNRKHEVDRVPWLVVVALLVTPAGAQAQVEAGEDPDGDSSRSDAEVGSEATGFAGVDRGRADSQAAVLAAPPRPVMPADYRSADPAMDAAREIRRRVPWFTNRRAEMPLASWDVDASHVWRVRTEAECHAHLRELGIRFVPYVPEESGEADEADDETLDVFPTPAPVIVVGPIGGVRFTSATGRALMSCELAARLPAIARVLARHGVTRVAISSLYRTGPLQSFHTFGLGIDIHRMQVSTPLNGPDGRSSQWLTVRTDFVETPDVQTCDPSVLGQAPGGNERGRVLLDIACELHETGAFATVLTPNYNEGHRGHFHIDVRPDDPRTYIR